MPARLRIPSTVERKHPRMPRFVVVPSAAVGEWRLAGTTTVEGTLNGVAIGRRSLKRWDDERWFLDLPEALCRAAGVETGDAVELLLQIASERLPDELARLLEADAAARRAWEGLTPSQRRMVREHVASAVRPETRRRRAERALQPC